MPVVTYIDHKGNAVEADVPSGTTVMEGAVNNGIEGIIAECGGACVCSTCHCMVEENWREITGAPNEDEDMMLEAVSERSEGSRLSCQLVVTDEMDGLVVKLPESQY